MSRREKKGLGLGKSEEDWQENDGERTEGEMKWSCRAKKGDGQI